MAISLASDTTTYFATKQAMAEYQAAKNTLTGKEGPFTGWVRSGAPWENFNLKGEILHPLDNADGQTERLPIPFQPPTSGLDP